MVNQELVASIRDAIEGMGSVLEQADGMTGATKALGIPGTSMKRIVPSEVKYLFLYLTASDGVIDDAEVEFFNEVFGYSFTAQECKELIVKCGIYSNEFANRLPLLFNIALYSEEWMRARTHTTGIDAPDLVETMINGYQIIGKQVMSADGSASLHEKVDLYDYINSIRKQVSELRPVFRKKAQLS